MNQIRQQLVRIYQQTGGLYSNNPRRIQADLIAERYMRNIRRTRSYTAGTTRIGQMALAARTNAELAASAPQRERIFNRIANRQYSRATYMGLNNG